MQSDHAITWLCSNIRKAP